MLSHDQIWSAVDALAARFGLSPSALARKAGLDPTTFNKSKRFAGDGRPRWPSTESLAKVLEATAPGSTNSMRCWSASGKAATCCPRSRAPCR
ncbi:hypothetical protein A6302_03579 [Methylobrevis pamukkalensis]|uniref:Helix-turn-helix transcriptional regulator n=1 Tax=Methylobrevis pamukkalensis TaxID=1439726 RepID=A0A1E3GYG6_9HYPH|nr:hypothetical protein A6302_03579 [Methylobrevis pamukkalensis]